MEFDIEEYMINQTKTPKQIGDLVLVYNGAGKLIETHSAFELAKRFFTMSNDGFFSMYGFNFVPKGVLWEKAKRAVGKM